MNKAVVLVLGSISLAACSTLPESAKPDPNAARFNRSIVQVPVERNRGEFFFCDKADTQCPGRTTKILSIPKKPEAPAIVESQVISAPVSKTYKVHFRWGWAHLDSNGKQELLAILSSLDKTTVKEVVIEGRTDPTGSLAFNKRLAKNRANVVRKEFVDFGISPDFIVAKPQKPCCDGDLKASSAEMREKRRSDIEITIRQK